MAKENVIAAMSLLALRQVGEGLLHAAGLGATAEGFKLLGERLRGHFSSHRGALGAIVR